MIILQEGLAKIKVPKESLKKISSKAPVFYNPIMKINRDISVLFLNALKEAKIIHKKLSILDAMGASGIRSIRYILECPEVIDSITIVDISPLAITNIKENLKINDINRDIINVKNLDCRIEMLSNKYDFIDIDPFGTPIPFIPSALESLRHKGILAVTATDVSALSGSKKRACKRKYGVISHKKIDFYLEFGIRNLIKYIIEEGAKRDYAMIPIFGYYYKHHYRVFFQKFHRKSKTEKLLEYIKYFEYDDLYRNIYTLGNFSDKKIYGPTYIGEIYNEKICELMYKYSLTNNIISKDTKKILYYIYYGDCKMNNIWYYYDIKYISKGKGISKLRNIDEILKLVGGVRTHYSSTGIKTNLNEFSKDILEKK